MTAQPFTFEGHQSHLNENMLMAARCQNCQSIFLPPRPLCTSCFKTEMDWIELSGKGTLAAFTVVHIAPTAMLNAGYGRENPYCSGIVHLEEGPMISAQILNVDVDQPETIQIGITLESVFVEREEGESTTTYLAFQPENQ
jgi:uncharacterized OB-fold protein